MIKSIILFLILTASCFGITFDQQEVLKLVNEERAKIGVEPLKINENLNEVSKIKSNDMHKNNYFGHTSSIYGSPFDLMKSYDIKYTTAGENIAKGQTTPEEVMSSWMNSEGHKKNILNPKFEEMGVSRDDYGDNIWTQMFIGNTSNVIYTTEKIKPEIEENKIEKELEEISNSAKKFIQKIIN